MCNIAHIIILNFFRLLKIVITLRSRTEVRMNDSQGWEQCNPTIIPDSIYTAGSSSAEHTANNVFPFFGRLIRSSFFIPTLKNDINQNKYIKYNVLMWHFLGGYNTDVLIFPAIKKPSKDEGRIIDAYFI